MKEQILDFIGNVKSDKRIFSFDEAATKNAIILRCLSLLGWDVFNVDEVYPEYSVGGDRVDYSLRISNADKVFLEVKRVREDLENHQEQLLNYSFKQGIKLAVLTNGVTWWFYLPLLEGDWEQRKFYIIDVFQQEAEDIASRFLDFLAKEHITSGKAFDNAEAVYKSQWRQKVLQETLPKAWNRIISEPDEYLVELINEVTEDICGYRTDDDMIGRFLSRHRERLLLPAAPPAEVILLSFPETPPPTLGSISEDYTGKKISSFYFRGTKYEVQFWYELLLKLCSIINTAHANEFDGVLELRGPRRVYFTHDEGQLMTPKKIPNTSIFVETHWPANMTVRICRRLLVLFGYSDDDLKIELRVD